MLDKSKIIVILQVRSSSLRLPGKALLPLAGIPLACLSALRAANTGLHVVVATSTDHSDDHLVEVLNHYKISVSRGSLPNVFQRFDQILSNCSSDTISVRLTGDNVFPDGQFIEDAVSEFLKRKLNYLRSDMEFMPYGFAVEVFSKHAFDKAKTTSLSSFDQEHVTPKLRELFGDAVFKSEAHEGQKVRCTIDYHKDYEKIFRVFQNVINPIQVLSAELIHKLKILQSGPKKLCLGTVQLGLKYGVSNTSGQPNREVAFEILSLASQSEIEILDTARGYGSSEEVIGNFNATQSSASFKICSKVSPVLNESSPELFKNSVRESIDLTLRNLQVKTIDTLLLHRFHQLSLFQGAAIEVLQEFKAKKIINKIGVSIGSVSELVEASKLTSIDHIQMPFNILDSRWYNQREFLSELSHRVIIHTRSAFLQGLILLKEKSKWPKNLASYFDETANFINLLENKFQSDIKSVAMRYCLSTNWIDAVVVGVESPDQLREIIELSSLPIFSSDEMNYIESHRPNLNNILLDPSQWSTRE